MESLRCFPWKPEPHKASSQRPFSYGDFPFTLPSPPYLFLCRSSLSCPTRCRHGDHQKNCRKMPSSSPSSCTLCLGFMRKCHRWYNPYVYLPSRHRYEWFISLDFDWELISGKKKFRWPMVIPIHSRCVHDTHISNTDLLPGQSLSFTFRHDWDVSGKFLTTSQLLK